MTEKKRPRGRPAGTSKDDKPFLNEVADLILSSEPKLTPTAAMRGVIRKKTRAELGGATDATLIRRWQSKWKQHKEVYLTLARQRRTPLPQTQPPGGFSSRAELLSLRAASALARDNPVLKQMQDYFDSPAYKAMQSYRDSPMYKMAQGVLNSPSYMAVIKQSEVALQMMRESSFQRQLRDFQRTDMLLRQFDIGKRFL